MPEALKHRTAPSLLLSLLEGPRALAEASLLLPAHGLLKRLPKGDGHSVMTLPGFLAGDSSTRVLRRYLEIWGYRPHPWRLGRNMGLQRSRDIEAELDRRLVAVHRKSGRRKVTLIGWSLGGLFAREIARRHPNRVRGVITLGSPLGHPKATNAWRVYELVSGTSVNGAEVSERLKDIRKPIPGVPATAIFSKSDSIVAWQTSQEPESDLTENVEVVGSHFGLGVNPMVLYVIADRLQKLTKGKWKPFNYKSVKRTINS